MSISKIIEELRLSSSRPNKFTIGIGELIRKAREESGYSQRALSELTYLRQATISDIENGKTEPDAETLLLLSHYLNKPISYFFPKWCLIENSDENSLSSLEQEFLLFIRQLDDNDLRRLIVQARALVELSKQK